MSEIAIDTIETVSRRRVITVKDCHVDEVVAFVHDLIASGAGGFEEWERQIRENYEVVSTTCHDYDVDCIRCTDITEIKNAQRAATQRAK